jgi:hypothetical protein
MSTTRSLARGDPTHMVYGAHILPPELVVLVLVLMDRGTGVFCEWIERDSDFITR